MIVNVHVFEHGVDDKVRVAIKNKPHNAHNCIESYEGHHADAKDGTNKRSIGLISIEIHMDGMAENIKAPEE